MESQLIEVMNMKMHTIQFAVIVNLIQMKSMKVIDTRKNMINQEFQHCSESQLIEVMILKIHTIQFAVIVNLIQFPQSFMSLAFAQAYAIIAIKGGNDGVA
jgi:hypothetical protein